jgi:DNA-binding NarL/FixJ family response regulator
MGLSVETRTVKFHVSNFLRHFKLETRYELRQLFGTK